MWPHQFYKKTLLPLIEQSKRVYADFDKRGGSSCFLDMSLTYC